MSLGIPLIVVILAVFAAVLGAPLLLAWGAACVGACTLLALAALRPAVDRLALLEAIGDGHRFAKDIAEASGYRPASVAYALNRLEQEGYVAAVDWSEGELRRPSYTLTSKGERAYVSVVERRFYRRQDEA